MIPHPGAAFLLALFACLALPLSGQKADRVALIEQADAVYQSRDKAGAYPIYHSATTDGNGRLIADSLTGYALHKMGVCAQYTDRTAEAVDHYHQAIEVRKKALGQPHNDIAKTQANLASLYQIADEPDSMAAYLYQATAAYENIDRPDTVNWVRALGDLAWLASRRYDKLLLHDATDRARELIGAPHSPVDEYEAALLQYNFGLYFVQAGDLDKATRFTDQALQFGLLTGDEGLQSSCYNTLYLIAMAGEDGDAGRKNLLRAIALFPEENLTDELGIYYSNLAYLELEAGRGEHCRVAAGRGLGLLPAGHIEIPIIHRTLSSLALLRGDSLAALSELNLGVASLSDSTVFYERGLAHQPFGELKDERLSFLASLLFKRAQLCDALGKSAAARLDYGAAIESNELLRSRVTSDASRRFLSEDIRPIYDAAIRHAATNGELFDALLLSDRARAYTLNANLRAAKQTLPAREAELNRRIGRLEATADDDPALQSELISARLERDRLRSRSIEQRAPVTTQLTQADVIAYLAKHQTDLVQYHVAEDTSLLFHVTPGAKIEVHYLPGAATLSERAREFRRLIRATSYRRKSLRSPEEQRALEEQFMAYGRDFARALVPWWEGTPGAGDGRILLIPDGALSFFPFAALPMSEEQLPLDYASISYLGTEATLRHAYSLSTLLAGSERRVGNQNIVAMAPAFSAALGQLTENEREVAGLSAEASNATCITGPAASRSAFLEASPTANILHLSTHGYSDAANPNQSWIAFSQSAPTLDPEQLLYYPEIATLPIAADLVVLSACETSLGKYIPGETSLSLASAFTAAGARSTVNTLWRVDDRATADLMIGFYEGLSAGEDRADALRHAQQALVAGGEFAHPHYWAGVGLTGADGVVDLGSSGAPWWLFFLAAGALAALIVLAIRR